MYGYTVVMYIIQVTVASSSSILYIARIYLGKLFCSACFVPYACNNTCCVGQLEKMQTNMNTMTWCFNHKCDIN